MLFQGTLNTFNGAKTSTKTVFKVNTATNEIKRMQDSPFHVHSHQVIFLEGTDKSCPQGSVYLFGGRKDGIRDMYNHRSYRYDVETDTWHALADL